MATKSVSLFVAYLILTDIQMNLSLFVEVKIKFVYEYLFYIYFKFCVIAVQDDNLTKIVYIFDKRCKLSTNGENSYEKLHFNYKVYKEHC